MIKIEKFNNSYDKINESEQKDKINSSYDKINELEKNDLSVNNLNSSGSNRNIDKINELEKNDLYELEKNDLSVNNLNSSGSNRNIDKINELVEDCSINKSEEQKKIDLLIDEMQKAQAKFLQIDDGKIFKASLKDKNSLISQLIGLLKTKDNQKYFLSLCEEGEKITFALFSRVLQKCSFIEKYIKQQNALVMNFYEEGWNFNNLHNKVIIVNKNNINNNKLKEVCKNKSAIRLVNHPNELYGLEIGKQRKANDICGLNCLQIFTYNNPTKWFWPTIKGTEQRATEEAELLSKIINYNECEKLDLSWSSYCVGNYFCFDLLEKALNNNDKTISITRFGIFNIIQNSLLHMGAEDIARKFIDFIYSVSTNDKISFENTSVQFMHINDFIHKNGCKEFGDALKKILNNNKEKYQDVISIIQNMEFFNNANHPDSYNQYINDQLDYFRHKIQEINNNQPIQNTTAIHQANRQKDKIDCSCCG